MEFLRKHVQTGALQETMDSCSSQSPASPPYFADTPISSEDLARNNVKMEHENGLGEAIMEISPSASYLTPPSYRKKRRLSVPSLDNSLLSVLTSSHSLDTDDDLEFFKGLLPSVRELSASNKHIFKHRICNGLFDLLEAQDNDKMDGHIKTDQAV